MRSKCGTINNKLTKHTNCDIFEVFQRRINGEVDFFLNWTSNINGFGNQSGEFWLGKIVQLSCVCIASKWKLVFNCKLVNKEVNT